jgi:hypothetical protein
MSTTDGEQDPDGERERTVPQAGVPPGTLIRPRSPLVPPRAPRRGGEAIWRIALALAGAAAIGFGVFAIASRAPSRSAAARGPAKAVFIARADAVCTRLDPVVDGEIQTLIADYRDGDLVGAHAAGSRLVSSTGELVAQISALGLPSTGAGTVRLILNEYGELVAALLTATGEGLMAAESIGRQIVVQATEFGFHVCGQI